MEEIKLDLEYFETIVICALRYCQGRQTYMPSLVQGIVKGKFGSLSDRALHIMLEDLNFMRECNLYGNETIDKPGWLKFEEEIKAEIERRRRRAN